LNRTLHPHPRCSLHIMRNCQTELRKHSECSKWFKFRKL
jgi:hypothetical protein